MQCEKRKGEMCGMRAPEFTLEASTGQKVQLNDLSGSYTVLVFYPANDTPVCDRQLDEFNVNITELLQHNCRIFGVNTASANKHQEYCTRKKLQFPILSDPNGATAKKYKAFWGWLGMNKRTVVCIGPNAEICFYERGAASPSLVLESIIEHKQSLQNA